MGKVICLLKGYLRIQIAGREPIRFLNLCKNRNIVLWDITATGQGHILQANIRIHNFFLLQDICRKTGTRATVLQKNGMPFFVPTIKKRFIYLFMCLFLLGYLWMMSFSIWNIELSGNKMISDEVIHDFLQANEVLVGMDRREIPIEELKFAFREEFPIITWIDISLRGTKLVITIQENTLYAVEKNNTSTFGSNLVADKEGMIVSIITRKGIPIVKQGDYVNVGDVLVQGNVPILDESASIVQYHLYDADATVNILTKEHVAQKISRTYTRKIYTGREKHIIAFIFRDYSVMMPEFGKKFEQEERITRMTQCKLFANFYLPYYRSDIWVREYQTQEIQYTDEQMQERVEEQVEKIMLSFTQKGVQILQKNVRIKESSTNIEIIADFQTCEEVGKSIPLTQDQREVTVKEATEEQ